MANKKIKILQTIRQGKIGGGETHVLDLVDELNPELYENVVLSFTQGPMVEKMKERGIKTYVIETEKPFDYSTWSRVKALIEQENIDIVHAHGTRANSNTFSSARKLGIPIIYTVHGWSFHPDQQFLVKKLRIFSEKFLVGKADLTLCVSESNLNDGKKLFPMNHAKVIKCGINLVKFNPEAAYDDLRTELGVKKETVLVGYLVRMTLQKDPLTLIKAISLLPKEMDIMFLFVGDGDLKNETVTMAETLGVTSRIIFMDFRQDIPNVLNAIDIYCLPSLWEGLPLGMLEAMAMKKAVVVTAIDGAKEVIADRKNGYLVSPRNAKQLAEGLTYLYNHPEARAAYGTAAHQTILADFSVTKMARAIEKEYDLLV